MKASREKGNLVLKLAKTVGKNSTTQACVWWVHQPKVPDALKRECEKK